MYCMIEVAFGNLKEAEQTVQKLLEEKLVASCQILESHSQWNWHQQLESSREYLVLMKTKKELQEQVYQVVQAIHSYQCFEFSVFDFSSCNKDYLKWIDEETIA